MTDQLQPRSSSNFRGIVRSRAIGEPQSRRAHQAAELMLSWTGIGPWKSPSRRSRLPIRTGHDLCPPPRETPTRSRASASTPPRLIPPRSSRKARPIVNRTAVTRLRELTVNCLARRVLHLDPRPVATVAGISKRRPIVGASANSCRHRGRAVSRRCRSALELRTLGTARGEVRGDSEQHPLDDTRPVRAENDDRTPRLRPPGRSQYRGRHVRHDHSPGSRVAPLLRWRRLGRRRRRRVGPPRSARNRRRRLARYRLRRRQRRSVDERPSTRCTRCRRAAATQRAARPQWQGRFRRWRRVLGSRNYAYPPEDETTHLSCETSPRVEPLPSARASADGSSQPLHLPRRAHRGR